MNPHVCSIDIAHIELDAFAQAQSHAVDGIEKDFVAQCFSCSKKLIHLLNS